MVRVVIEPSTNLNSEYSAYVSFDYNEKILNAIKKLPFRYYNNEMKDWEIPVSKVTTLQKQLFPTKFNIIDEHNKLHEKQEIKIPSGFAFKTKPFQHQVESFMYGLKYDKWFLGDEMGLGKSKTVIDIAVARKIKYGYNHCLIVCGVNTLKWNWVNEISTHSYEHAHILGQKQLKNGKLKIGSTEDKIEDLKFLLNEKTDETLPYFIITNIESFRNKIFADLIKNLCEKKIINMCAFDEAHKCKNPTSQQTKGFLKCLPECRIAMTGTPLMNSPLDLFTVFKWLGFERHTFTAFKSHYCIMGGFGGYEIVGYRYLDELQDKLNEIMVRRLKEDVFDLPEKTIIDEYVDMTTNQSKVYKEVQTDLKENIDKITNAIDPLSALIRLRQATGFTGILSTTIQESSKLDRMEELVEESIANNRKVVIFSNWTKMTDVIYDKLFNKQYGIMRITGDTKDSQRQEIVNAFQNTDMCRVLIGTIGAMGTGLTLTAGTVVIFLDEPWTMALYEQAVDRCHRIGQKNNITVYNLLCKGTIDEKIHNIVYQKGVMSDCIVDGKIIGDKANLVSYLLN